MKRTERLCCTVYSAGSKAKALPIVDCQLPNERPSAVKEALRNQQSAIENWQSAILDSQNVNQLLHRRRALVQRNSLFCREVDLDDLLQSARAEFAGHTNVQSVDAILAFQVSSARQNLLLVFQDRLRHLDCGRRRRVVRRTSLQQAHDLRATARSAFDDRVDLLFRQQLSDRNAGAG